jgi:acetolactate synthase I/II/III large subunit
VSVLTPHRPLFRALADGLKGLGVEHVFGVMGEDTASLTVGIVERDIAYHGTRHESVAVGMADGYAWAAKRLGVCMVTRGPGLMNAATACRTAVQGGRQVLVITGDVPRSADRRFDYKYIEQAPIAAAVGLQYFAGSEPDQALSAFTDAVACAHAGQPAVLAIPADVFALDTGLPRREAVAAQKRATAPADEQELERLTDLIERSHRALIIAGAGAADETTAADLKCLAEHTGALLGTTLLAKDLFRGHPLDIGVVGSFAGDRAIQPLSDLDCVIAFGASLTPFTTAQRTLFAGASVVQIDSDASRIGTSFPVAFGVVADAGTTAARLLERLDATGARPASAAVEAAANTQEEEPLYAGEDESRPGELDPRTVAVILDRLLPRERVVVLDSGRFMTSPGRFLRVPRPDCFRLTADAGSIAVGLGVALGAALARPRVAHVLFVGDGGLSMVLGDLETAVRHEIPLIVVVMNDRAYGAEWVHLQADGLPAEHAVLPEIDFAAVGRALGLEAVGVRWVAELEALGPRLAGRTRPLLIDCRIRRDLTVPRLRYPAAAPGFEGSS